MTEVQADPKVQEVYLGHAATEDTEDSGNSGNSGDGADTTTSVPQPTAVQEA